MAFNSTYAAHQYALGTFTASITTATDSRHKIIAAEGVGSEIPQHKLRCSVGISDRVWICDTQIRPL
jgi:hypothetical protein